MDKNVRFGIIGCGSIAAYHAKAIAEIENAELAAAFDAVPASAERFAQVYGVKAYAALEDMLASPDIDAVCICTPSGLHTAQAIAAMKAGKHVVCEKPMSLTLEEADDMIAAEKETGMKVCVISQRRFAASTQEVKRAIDEGALGKVTHASLSMRFYRTNEYYESGAWRGTWAMDGGGVLMNQGIHGIDVFRYLMGPAKSLCGHARTLIHEKHGKQIEVEDAAAAVLEFENGALGVLEGSTSCFPGYPYRIMISGELGSVVLEENSIVRWDLPVPCRQPVTGVGYDVSSAGMAVDGHVIQIGNLVNAILHGEALTADAHTGRLPLEIVMGIYESSRTGAPVVFGA